MVAAGFAGVVGGAVGRETFIARARAAVLAIVASASAAAADGVDVRLGEVDATPMQLRVSVKRILPNDGDYDARWSNARIRTTMRLASRLLADRAGLSLRLLEIVNVTDPGTPSSWWAMRDHPSSLERAARSGVADVTWRDDAVNVFLVKSLYVPGFGDAGGVCSFPPGGEIIVVSDVSGPAENQQAVTLAHELGHYAGLYHTHETSFGVDEPVPCRPLSPTCAVDGDLVCDTPPDPRDLSTLETLYGAPCDGIDQHALDRVRRNLMSYYLGELRIVVTPGQVERMRTHVEQYRRHVLERRHGRLIPPALSRSQPPPGCLAQCRGACPTPCGSRSGCAEDTRDCLQDCVGEPAGCHRFCRERHRACLASCRVGLRECLAGCRGLGRAVCARECREQHVECSRRDACDCTETCRVRCDLKAVAAH